MDGCDVPRGEHSWVLLAQADGAARRALESGLRDAGVEVYACDGPSVGRCALIDGEGCAVAAAADVVVVGLDDAERADRLIWSLAQEQGRRSIVLVDSRGDEVDEREIALVVQHTRHLAR